MTSKSVVAINIDMAKPTSQRPLVGFDIEQWRADLNLSKYYAQHALGFRNSNHYNKMCEMSMLPVVVELLIRLFDEAPCALCWEKFTLRELFDLMYGDAAKPFIGTKLETYAMVDLGNRFTKIFDRSPSRRYQWLEDNPKKNESELNAYSVMECILSKLKQVNDPAAVLERTARKVWALRGVDLDLEFPIPTVSNPPTREKTGRKSVKNDGLKPRGKASVKTSGAVKAAISRT